ncbi:enoyl-CoA hydratase/isomerase family protein [Nocardia sp. NPDC005745]|uniref:enoyl-CoA hydratase/isomerase family protein n=1 Tax=Nocardia sp. NPDC005745 TaxID=3157061 RepID=UPI0033E5074F
MTGYRGLRLTETDGVFEITLERPDRRNAIDAQMIDELHQVCADLEANPRLAILTGGADGVFAAGADIAELNRRGRADALAGINLNLFDRIRRLPMPTIAAMDGHALGGGAELSYACDIRIATPRTVFGQPEPRLGIIAGAGATHRLVRLVGESIAKQVLLAGANLTAERALAIGLVHSVVQPSELLTAAHELAANIAKSSAIALRMTKLAVDAGPDAHPELDLVIQAMLFEDDEKYRRMDAFLSRTTTPSERANRR